MACYALHMDEKRYHAIADATLMHCYDQLEDAYEAGTLDDLDLQGGILTIATVGGRTYLLTKHGPSHQLWYASPNLGGLHFTFDEGEQRWLLPDGRWLYEILRGELNAEQIEVVL
jgi:iron donor protein CyaY